SSPRRRSRSGWAVRLTWETPALWLITRWAVSGRPWPCLIRSAAIGSVARVREGLPAAGCLAWRISMSEQAAWQAACRLIFDGVAMRVEEVTKQSDFAGHVSILTTKARLDAIEQHVQMI